MADFADFGLLVGRYHLTPPTLSDSQPSEVLLDVNGRVVITATDLDIRDLSHVSDSVSIGDGTDILEINADGSINITDNGGSLTVDAVDLDIRDLSSVTDSVLAVTQTEFAEDSAHSSGDLGQFMLAVRNDVEGSLVDTDGDYAPLQVDSLGRLRVAADLSIVSSAEKAEDSAHVSGDIGNFVLAVRQDVLSSSTDADGDYSALKTNSRGELYVTASVNQVGVEAYTVSDAEAAGGDGLVTPVGATYVDLCSLAVGAGQVAYLYGWQADADINAQFQLVTDDGVDVKVYKTRLNSSAMPGIDEHWSESGRIEITGAAGLNVKVRARKRGSGQDGSASGSIHARIL